MSYTPWEREVCEQLARLIIATEKGAARLFWIALPIYGGVAVTALWIGVILLGLLSAR
jgi:hypothetical protein